MGSYAVNNFNYNYANPNYQYGTPSNIGTPSTYGSPYMINNSGIYDTPVAILPFPQEGTLNNVKNPGDDGKISFKQKASNFLKGVGNFFKGMVCDENGNFSIAQCAKTVAIGAVIGAASILIPGAGTAIALGFMAMGAAHVGKGIYDAATAKTDAEAEQAWQNIGSGTTESALAFAGCKKTGAFAKAKTGLKAAKESVVNIADAYKTAGVDGLKFEVKMQGESIVSNVKSNVIEPTKANWKSLTDKEVRFNNRKNSYKKSASAYEEGYLNVKDASYTDAVELVESYKSSMIDARKAAFTKGSTAADRAAYRNAQAKYSAAKSTLDTRIAAGEFKGRSPISETEITAKKAAVDNARQALDGSEAAYKNLADAKAEYIKAVAQKSVNEGTTTRAENIFRAKAAIADGIRQPNAGLLTITGAGRGYEDIYYAQ